MKKTQKAETFAGIIIWVFILSFVMLWIVSILNFSWDITKKYDTENRKLVLTQNLKRITQRIDTSELSQNELFFLNKNTALWVFEIVRPEECINNLPPLSDTSSCFDNRYIDALWNTVENIKDYSGDIFTQDIKIIYEDTSLWITNKLIDVKINTYLQ